MTVSHVDIIDRSSEQAHIWGNEVAAELGTEDRQAAYRLLRGFPHVLRDRCASALQGPRLLQAARDAKADLVALAWSQSLAPGRAAVVREALSSSPVPVLLIPVLPTPSTR